MDTKLTFRYDEVGDILHIDKCEPYLGQESDEIDELVVGRSNARTGELENIEVIFFMRRLKEQGSFTLPVTAEFKLAIEADV